MRPSRYSNSPQNEGDEGGRWVKGRGRGSGNGSASGGGWLLCCVLCAGPTPHHPSLIQPTNQGKSFKYMVSSLEKSLESGVEFSLEAPRAQRLRRIITVKQSKAKAAAATVATPTHTNRRTHAHEGTSVGRRWQKAHPTFCCCLPLPTFQRGTFAKFTNAAGFLFFSLIYYKFVVFVFFFFLIL